MIVNAIINANHQQMPYTRQQKLLFIVCFSVKVDGQKNNFKSLYEILFGEACAKSTG